MKGPLTCYNNYYSVHTITKVFTSVNVLADGGESIEPTVLDTLMDVFG